MWSEYQKILGHWLKLLKVLLYFESLPKNINELLIIFEDTFSEKGNNKKIIILKRKNSKKYLIEIKKVIID